MGIDSKGVVILLLFVPLCLAVVDPTRDCTGPNIPNPPTRTITTRQVAALRAKMATAGVDALIIPTADDHQNEYVSDHDKKRIYISGFTGSAGTALVTADAQLLWTDGRYFLAAADELDCNWWLMRSGNPGVPSLTEWIIGNMTAGKKIAADPKVISTGGWRSYKKTFTDKGLQFGVTTDLVGKVWDEDSTNTRPAESNNQVFPLEQKFAGRTWQQKIYDLRTELSNADVDALVVSALDDLAWLFNLRGSDIDYNPLFFAFAIVETDSSTNPKLYIRDMATRLANLTSHLNTRDDGACTNTNCVEIKDYGDIDDGVRAFNSGQKMIWISDDTNYEVSSTITDEKKIKKSPSPIMKMKAIKNSVERQGMRNSHIRDSATICELAARVEKELNSGSTDWTELKVVDTIDNMRRANEYNKGLSFNTICGSGKNGAYIHYSVNNDTNKAVNKDNMLLLDSGGQYLDGTTDITRTFHFGEPTEFQKLAYTLVLLGVIDLARAKFPANKTLGSSLDTLARRPMWEYGLDFGHGTGHGIGMFLSVHEGYQTFKIRARVASTEVSLEQPIYDGMFFSDEPGYYDDAREFGIRLETIIMARYTNTKYGAEDTTLEFEPIAFVPFEKKLIDLTMLSKEQREWLNDYHKGCRDKTGAFLKQKGKTEAYDWLMDRTEPVPLEGDYPTAAPSSTNDATQPSVTTSVIGLVMARVINYLL